LATSALVLVAFLSHFDFFIFSAYSVSFVLACNWLPVVLLFSSTSTKESDVVITIIILVLDDDKNQSIE
jgi:hypothetical protein